MSHGDNEPETKSRWVTVCQETLRRARRYSKQEKQQKPLEKKKTHLRAPWKKTKRPGSPRRRTSLACERCRKRKIKCTGEAQGAPCENCRAAGVTNCRFIRMGRTEEFLVELTLPEYPIEPPNASPEPPNPEPVKVSSFSTMNLPNPSSDSLPMPPPFSTSFGGYCHSYPENSSSTSLTTYSDYAPSPCHRSSTPDSRRPTTSPRPHTALSCVPEFDLRIPPLTSSSSSSVDLPSIYPPHSLDTMPSSPGMHEQMLPYIPEYSPLPQLSQHWQPTSPPPLDVPITSPADSSASPSPSFSPPHVRSASPIKRDSVVRGKSFNPGPTPLKAEFRVSFDPEKNVSPRSAAMPEVAYNSAISPSATGSHAHVNTDVKAPTASSYLPMQSLLTPITPPGDYGHNLGYPITAFPPNSMDMPPTFSDPWKQPSEVQYQHRHFNLDQPSPLDYSSPLVSRASFSSPPQEFYAFNQSPPPSRYANYTTHSSR